MSETKKQRDDPDRHKGAVEADPAGKEDQADHRTPGVGPDGLPSDPVASAQDRLGANVADSEVAQASETGQLAEREPGEEPSADRRARQRKEG